MNTEPRSHDHQKIDQLLQSYRDLRDAASHAQVQRDQLALLMADLDDPRQLYRHDATTQQRWHRLDAEMWRLRRLRDTAWDAYGDANEQIRTT